MPRSIVVPLILAGAAVATGGCSTRPAKPEGQMDIVYIDMYGAHLHYMSRTTLTIRGDMPEVRGIAEMTAVMDEGTLVKMSMAAAPGERYAVPNSLLTDIPALGNDSFKVQHAVTAPPRSVAVVVVWIDFQKPSSEKADCSAENPPPDSRATGLTLSFDAKTHVFERKDFDECVRTLRIRHS